MALPTSAMGAVPGSSEILWAGSQVQSTAYLDSHPRELEKAPGSGIGPKEDSGRRQAGHWGLAGLCPERIPARWYPGP